MKWNVIISYIRFLLQNLYGCSKQTWDKTIGKHSQINSTIEMLNNRLILTKLHWIHIKYNSTYPISYSILNMGDNLIMRYVIYGSRNQAWLCIHKISNLSQRFNVIVLNDQTQTRQHRSSAYKYNANTWTPYWITD